MKKIKQILALIIVFILIVLYLTTLILAIFDSSYSMGFFKASAYATVIFPTLLFIYSFVYKMLKNSNKSKED